MRIHLHCSQTNDTPKARRALLSYTLALRIIVSFTRRLARPGWWERPIESLKCLWDSEKSVYYCTVALSQWASCDLRFEPKSSLDPALLLGTCFYLNFLRLLRGELEWHLTYSAFFFFSSLWPNITDWLGYDPITMRARSRCGLSDPKRFCFQCILLLCTPGINIVF